MDGIQKLTSTSAQSTSTDMPEKVTDELLARYELLPEDVQKMLMDDGYQTRLFDIAKANKLTYEELATLERETTMVLLGMTNPQDYRDELQTELKKNDSELDTLVKTINEQVFTPLRASLERLYANREAEETQQESLSMAEESVLEKTGVVINESNPFIPQAPQAPLPERSDILNAIENPPKSSGPGIIASKLAGSDRILTPTKTTDYSLPKTGSSNTDITPQSSDPYREPVN